MRRFKAAYLATILFSLFACTSKDDAAPTTPTIPTNPDKFVITDNQLMIDGVLFAVNDTDLFVTKGNFDAGYSQYALDINRGPEISLSGTNTPGLFYKGMILDYTSFKDREVWEFQYSKIGSGNERLPNRFASYADSADQGTIVILNMVENTTSFYGVSLLTFEFNNLLVLSDLDSMSTLNGKITVELK